jgi:phage baseplate assembly protein W
MPKLNNLYSDIDLMFNAHPGKGDIVLSYGDQAVIRSVRNLLSTNFYERPFQPFLGSNMNALLFEPVNSMTAGALEEDIKNVLSNYEPRVSISEIKVTAQPDNNAFSVRVAFFIGNNTLPTSVSLLLERKR